MIGLDDAAITERFRDLELRRRRDEAELAALIAVAEARGVYAADGHLTVKGWLRANANWSPAEVNAARRKARLVKDHPSVGDALLDGHIGAAQVGELGRARGRGTRQDEVRTLDPGDRDFSDRPLHPQHATECRPASVIRRCGFRA